MNKAILKHSKAPADVMNWLESKWWFLPKKATGFRVLIEFPKTINAKREFLNLLQNDFGFYIDKQNAKSVVLKKGIKELLGPIKLLNDLLMKGWTRTIINILPFLQRYGVEAQFMNTNNQNYVRFVITPFMELFDLKERFLFSQNISESFADELYTKNYVNRISKKLKVEGGKIIVVKPTGALWLGKYDRKKL